MSPDRRKTDDMKELIKEAIRESNDEWLERKFAVFGRWSITGLSALLFVWVLSMWITAHRQELVEIIGTKAQLVSP